MSQKMKIARYPATRSQTLPEEVNGVIDAIGSTGFDRSDMAAIYCKSDLSAWHLMTKKRRFYEVIFSPLEGGSVPFLRSTTGADMMQSMGLNWVLCPWCRGTCITMSSDESGIVVGKCRKCSSIGFVDPDADQDFDDVITIARAQPPAAKIDGPEEPAPSAEGIESMRGGTREKIAAFLQEVKQAYIPASRDLIGKKCAGKDVTKDAIIEAIVDTFIDAILDAEEKSG